MGHFVKLSMVLLLLIFFTDDLQAKYIRRTKGKNVTIPFTLQLNNSLTLKYVSLYKDGSKIEESNKKAQDTRRSFSLTSHEAILYISNLSTTDEGKYYVSLFYNELTGKVIESNTTFLQITMEEHTTVSTPTSNQTWSVTSTTSPHGSFVYIPIIAGLVVCIMILFTLLLGWQYLTYNKSRDCQHSHQEQSPQGSSPKCEVKREVSSSVEYNVLDFPRRPRGKEGDRRSFPPPQPQESVEYSSITFFHGPHGAGGAVSPPRGQ